MIQDICLLHRKDDFAYNQDPGISFNILKALDPKTQYKL